MKSALKNLMQARPARGGLSDSELSNFSRLNFKKVWIFYQIIQRNPHINSLPIGKLLVPREGSHGGCKSPRADGLARGLRGKPMWEHLALAAESDETFPRVSPFDEDSIVNNIEYHKIKIKN